MIMKRILHSAAVIASVAIIGAVGASVASAESASLSEFAKGGNGGGKGPGGGGGGGGGGGTSTYTLQNWMSPELADVWADGHLGQGTTITVVDDFSSQWGYYGDLGEGTQLHRHGEWTQIQSSMVAPEAQMKSHDFYSGSRVRLQRKTTNVLNLSYGMMADAVYDLNQIRWGAQEASIIDYAQNGQAVISKSSGNDAVEVGGTNADGLEDYLATALIGAQSALFVGALDGNGTIANPASMASYSNYAGTNVTVQDQFLVVGVHGDLTDLYGTSFAAPIVSGYASLLGSKFSSATPTQIADQLLNTARTDTILGYSTAIHGQGEASIARAIAPVSIN